MTLEIIIVIKQFYPYCPLHIFFFSLRSYIYRTTAFNWDVFLAEVGILDCREYLKAASYYAARE